MGLDVCSFLYFKFRQTNEQRLLLFLQSRKTKHLTSEKKKKVCEHLLPFPQISFKEVGNQVELIYCSSLLYSKHIFRVFFKATIAQSGRRANILEIVNAIQTFHTQLIKWKATLNNTLSIVHISFIAQTWPEACLKKHQMFLQEMYLSLCDDRCSLKSQSM